MADKQYKVTAPCVVHVPVSTSDGPMLGTFYKDAILPTDVPEGKLKHLLDSGLIAEIGKAAEVAASDPGPGNPPELKQVNSQSSKADLVAYAVTQGMAQEDAEKLKRDELLGMYVRKQGE